ncbi:hypothetical protein IPM19_03460 [bacterium]|nr:MAG: hypothetical protein IPM19_03460 [bacterium]
MIEENDNANGLTKTITVKMGSYPGGKVKPYTFPEGTDYGEALRQANLTRGNNVEALDIRVNGQKISSPDALIEEGDQILVFENIRGNN